MKTSSLFRLSGLAAALATATSARAATTLTPISGTGYNVAAIANATTPVSGSNTSGLASAIATSTNGTLDGYYVFYARGFDADATGTGLPAGGALISATNPVATFAIQAASKTSAVNDVLLVTASSPAAGVTFTLASTATYSNVSFLVSGFNGDQSATYTLNYANGTTAAGTFTAPDNFDSSPAAAFTVAGRLRTSDNSEGVADQFADVGTSNPRLFEVDLTGLSTLSTLKSITFGGALVSTEAYAVFGVSGFGTSAVPEPSTWAMLAAGAGLLGGVVFRRRTA